MQRQRAADETLGSQVRAARMSRGVSLRTLARSIGVSPATLSQIENGRTGLSVVRLGHVADALGLEVHHILDAADTEAVDVQPPLTGPDMPAARTPEGAVAPLNWREYAPLDFDPVLRAALAEFLDIGYHGSTVRGIASRCGLSVSGLYHYYPSKQHMLRAIFDYTMDDLLRRSHAARAEGEDAVTRFGLLVENLALYHTHRRELGFVGASEMRGFDAANRTEIAHLRTVQQHMVDEEVAHAVREGHFRPDHPYEASRAVVTMCTALTGWWRPEGPLSPAEIAAQYVGFAYDLMRFVPGQPTDDT